MFDATSTSSRRFLFMRVQALLPTVWLQNYFNAVKVMIRQNGNTIRYNPRIEEIVKFVLGAVYMEEGASGG